MYKENAQPISAVNCRRDFYSDIIRTYWRELDDLIIGFLGTSAITRIGEEIAERDDLIHPKGLDIFEKTLSIYRKRKPEHHILVAGNHPDFQSSDAQNPLWFFEILGTIGKVEKKEPYTFVSGSVVPNFLEKFYSSLLIVEKDESRPLKNIDILRRTREIILGGQPEYYFIFPEGRNNYNDVLSQGHAGGISIFIETALQHNVPLSILPIGLEQKLVSRNEAKEKDEYTLRTGKIIDVRKMPLPVRRTHPEVHQAYADYIMRTIAELIPEDKRGYYAQLN